MHTPATQVILIGGSAGAYDLIVKILEVLPKPCNHAVVVILHRNPKFSSSIEKSLSEKFGRDVSQAKDKESIRSNVIYFAPPGYHLLMEPDYSFSLDISEPVDFSRPSINVSFESAADVYGTHLKLFLLSGANADGAKGLAFKIEESTDIPEFVSFDAQRLQQVINNFLNNSLKFTEKGGIILSVKTIDSEPGRSKLRFEVQDTGIGISETHLSKIFQEFEQGDGAITKRYGGSGLGLAIVKRLANLMGGQVGTISEYGVGSTFYFEAWFEETPFSEAKKINELYVNFPKLPGTRVLIAEDNDLNAFMLSHILKSWDCKVDTVTNGALVLENLQNRKYDIILMDTHMPVMSGFEAIEKIRASQDESIRNTPVISISASVLQHEQAAALQAGAEEVIGKPFEPLDLYQKITKILKVDLPTTSEEHNS